MIVLGEAPADDARRERARFLNRLFAGPWTDPAVMAQEGYARDHFHALLDRATPPPERPGIWRALERLTWQLHRCFVLLQAQRQALDSTPLDGCATL